MQLCKRQSDHAYLLERAKEALGRPVRALTMVWDIERRLQRRLRLVTRSGIAADYAVVQVTTDKKGWHLESGLEIYRLQGVEPALEIVKIDASWSETGGDALYDFWAVATGDYSRFVAYLRNLSSAAWRQQPPIMDATTQARLWNNTIGFLSHRADALKKYDVPQRRGVLLIGGPGGGKTMACRWLRSECRRRKLGWKTVCAADYHEASVGQRRRFFELQSPGVILFDDLDLYVRDRERHGTTPDGTTFLTELDGVETRRRVVYLFTTNASLSDLDPAFRRPGRIDQVIEFPRPCRKLRRKLIDETWHRDIRAAVNVDHVEQATSGLSFAEIEEIKKLLVLHFLDNGAWSFDAAWATFQSVQRNKVTRPIGFAHSAARRNAEAAGSLSAVDTS